MEATPTFDVTRPLTLIDDAVAQWLDWEQQANLVGFRAKTQPVAVEVVSVPLEEVEVHILPGAPSEIIDRFLRNGRVLIPRHPLNRDPSVAWSDAPVSERWQARFTSSRTLAMPGPETGSALFSVKLATDHPHPDFHQPEKTKLREESDGAILWSALVARVDAKLGPMRETRLITEVLVVMERGGQTGLLVRDLRLFQSGNYYLPALSLPWVGRQIAARHGEDFDRFWGRHFAAPVGRSKAELFARYGLWYETPNPQNVVIELDRVLRPTGRIIFRDIGDGECATDTLWCKEVPWTKLEREIRPETENSFWAFGEAGGHSVPPDVLATWYRLHDDAYFGELAAWFPEVVQGAGLAPEARLEHWNRVLRSEIGREAVARAFAHTRRR